MSQSAHFHPPEGDIRERRQQPSRQQAKKDALTFTRLQEHQDAFLQWLSEGTSPQTYQYIR